ncbi:hypothetical protein FACS189487_04510 [Campylobacterota bacterium]|nr:hypothetical protein FACS189487_04510 [Campylobacterota bacterium]
MIEIDAKSMLITQTDRNGVICAVSDEFCKITGYHEHEIVGKTHAMFCHSDMPKIIFTSMWETITKGQVWHGFIKSRVKNGDFFWAYLSIFPASFANADGFIAVRTHAFEDEIERYETRYKKLFEKEQK